MTPRFVVGRGRWRGATVGLAGILAVILFGTALLRPSTAAQTTAAAPSFTLPLLAGDGRLALEALRGHPVLLNFWASYCEACKQEMPTLEAAYRRYRARGIVMVGVDTLGDVPAEARALVRTMGLTYPMVLDARQDVADRYNVAGLPTSVFIDAAGRVRGTVVGAIDDATLRCGWGLSDAASCAQTRLVAVTSGATWAGPSSTQPDIAWPSGKWRADLHAHESARAARITNRASWSHRRPRLPQRHLPGPMSGRGPATRPRGNTPGGAAGRGRLHHGERRAGERYATGGGRLRSDGGAGLAVAVSHGRAPHSHPRLAVVLCRRGAPAGHRTARRGPDTLIGALRDRPTWRRARLLRRADIGPRGRRDRGVAPVTHDQ